jgi:NADH:ubiquinone reductase (H+-translocating)
VPQAPRSARRPAAHPGAGFGGLSAVSALARGGFAVTLADRHIYSTFQPLLYQVATAGLAPSDVAYPLRGFARKHGAGGRPVSRHPG